MLNKLIRMKPGRRTLVFPVKILPLHCMMSSMGCERRENERYHLNGLQRGGEPFAIWQYTVSGRGRLRYEGEEHDIPPGTAMCLQVPHDHAYFLPDDAPHWKFIYLTLYGTELTRIWRDFIQHAGPLVPLDPAGPSLARASDILHRAFNKTIHSAFEASALVYTFIMTMAGEVLPERPDTGVPEFMRRAVRYCLDHLDEPVTVDDMADAAGLSRYHFTRLFTARQGLSPARFMTHLRLREAVRLLQNEPLSIKEIAAQCGFSDPSYFCRVFRKTYQTSPQAFRTGF